MKTCMKISDLIIENSLFLAPMAGVTDRAFRYMCKKYSAGATVTEMVSAKALCYEDKKTHKLATIYKEDRPCGLQLFGSEPEIMARGAVIALEKFSPDFIDINMGCPAPKIVNNNEGCSLMKNPQLVFDILREVVACVGGKVPVTVKMRSGFDKDNINAPLIAEMCQKGGASAVFVHGRTRSQMYMPPVDLEVIKEVKKSVSIPVVGNGDIKNGIDALKMMEYTLCDGIMVGRASLGNPYVFDEINAYLSGKNPKEVSKELKKQDIKEHICMLVEDKGEFIGVCEARKHVAWYIKGMPDAALLRNEVNCARSLDNVLSIIDKAF